MMEIRCISCGEKFIQKRFERTCGKQHAKPDKPKDSKFDTKFYYYLNYMKNYFDNPIYQFYKLMSPEYIPIYDEITDDDVVKFFESLEEEYMRDQLLIYQESKKESTAFHQAQKTDPMQIKS